MLLDLRKVLALALAVTFVASACSGADESASTESTAASTNRPVAGSDSSADSSQPAAPEAVADVAPSLAPLGELAVVASEPETVTFDESGGLYGFADGTMVNVPEGAFAEPTEVTAVLVDLVFEEYLENAPDGTVYVMSTASEVELAQPISLQVPVSSTQASVKQLIDGRWEPIAVEPVGLTIEVPIRHFSEVPTIVVEPRGVPEVPPEELQGATPAELLKTCIVMLVPDIRDFNDITKDDEADIYDQLFFRVCAQALVNTLSAGGQDVNLGCVGDRVDGGASLESAIDECTQDGADTSTDEVAATDGEDSPDAPTAERTGSGGLLPNPFIPGSDGSIKSESIVLTIDDDSVSLSVDVAYTFGVSYVDGELVCSDDFVLSGGGSDLALDGSNVAGSIELTTRYENAPSCPDAEQEDIGVPYAVEVSGVIDGGTLRGSLMFASLDIGFTAQVVR